MALGAAGRGFHAALFLTEGVVGTCLTEGVLRPKGIGVIRGEDSDSGCLARGWAGTTGPADGTGVLRG